MNPAPTREESLFQAAAALPTADRAAFLDQECAANAPLRARLDVLLAAHEQWDESLDGGDGANRPTVKVEVPAFLDPAVGQTIGRYKLLEKLGEGGCGVVYVAEQTEPVRRRVALKVIKLGMDTREVIARFEFVKALTELRRGKLAEAIDWSTRSIARPAAGPATTVAAGAVLAMARHQLNQPEAARTALAHAADLARTSLPKSDSGDLGPNWPRQLAAQIVLREARSALESRENAARKEDIPAPLANKRA